ncbi:HD domain-containing protein [Bdellovibrionales bacterium]|nr:HD domain-containing protein [Bdellovibrionales bacterium]
MTEENGGSYLKIRLNSLHPSLPLPFDVYVLINQRMVHYLRAGDTITAEKIHSFEKKAPDNFYIKGALRQAYKSYVHDLLADSTINPHRKALILRESSYALVEELFESPDIERALHESKEIIENFVNFMENEPDSMGQLIGLSSHDFYTYTHSLDVGIYSLGLARVAGYSGHNLFMMGQGALFHDIGKRQVDIEIICKDGPLDDQEWVEMKKHPEYGLAILQESNASEELIACCFEHHENALGNGYPQQLSASEIHPMARIVALTDTFDALTTKRSYNEPMPPPKALDFMAVKLKGKYDTDLLNAMYETLFKMEKHKIK